MEEFEEEALDDLRVERGSRQPDLGDLGIVAVVAVLLGILTTFPAGNVRLASKTHVVRLGDFLGFRYFLMAVCALFLAVAALEILVRKRPARIAAVGFSTIALTAMAWIVTVEGAARLIPRSLLPATVRRFTVGMGASWAAWLILALAGVAALACLGLLRPIAERVGPAPGESTRQTAVRLGGLVVAVIGIVLIGVGRVAPIVTVAGGIHPVDVEIWALPYIGPGMLIGLVTLVLGVIGTAARWRSVAVGSVCSGVAWFTASVAGLLVATKGLLVDTSLIERVAKILGQDNFARNAVISDGPGALLLFAGALLAGLGFASQVAWGVDEQ